jgi:hypothetical protein
MVQAVLVSTTIGRLLRELSPTPDSIAAYPTPGLALPLTGALRALAPLCHPSPGPARKKILRGAGFPKPHELFASGGPAHLMTKLHVSQRAVCPPTAQSPGSPWPLCAGPSLPARPLLGFAKTAGRQRCASVTGNTEMASSALARQPDIVSGADGVRARRSARLLAAIRGVASRPLAARADRT